MNADVFAELSRLTENAGVRRETLLVGGLRKSSVRKLLTVIAGVLSLCSAGAIALVLASVFGQKGTQIFAAVTAGLSGTISLVTTSYLTDDEIFSMLKGASKYLALRDAVYRLSLQPTKAEDEVLDELSHLQNEYASLDEAYSKHLPIRNATQSHRPPRGSLLNSGDVVRIQNAGLRDRVELERLTTTKTHGTRP